MAYEDDSAQATTAAQEGERLSLFARRVLVGIGLVALALLLWQIVNALLLAFSAILLAVFLHGLARRVGRHTPLSESGAVLFVLLILAGLIGLSIWLLGPYVVGQVNDLVATLPQSLEALRENLRQHAWGAFLLEHASPQEMMTGKGDVFSRITGYASTTLGVLVDLLLILFAGIYFAMKPGLYKRGMVALVPPARRTRAKAALEATGHALWRWLLAKLAAMLVVGALVALGLWLIGVPLAFVLGLVSAVFNFVPFIGPTIAAVPGVLVALTVGVDKALYAALVYFAAQQIDGNIVTPLVQREAVAMPPALTVLGLAAFGLLFGLYGVILAAPLLVVAFVLVKMLYVEGVLHDPQEVPGRRQARADA